jgi:hypothetical protein
LGRSRRAVPIEVEIKRRGIPLKGNGTERVGPCPKCGGDDRFSINTKKNVFNCRGCDVGGDVIDLVRHLDGSDFIAACTRLAGEPPPLPSNGASPQRSNGAGHSADQHKVHQLRKIVTPIPAGAPAPPTEHPQLRAPMNGNYNHGARTTEAINAGREVNALLRYIRKCGQGSP